ncbi:MAG: M13 family metallopeptidase, partial [Acidobacteria bacterium]|nr:M13 family metallopeptidase [Acidobacteriota bacterium]
RRWAAGELSKDRLKEILEQAASKKDAPAGSPERLIGDFYASGMDEARINTLGVEPLKPWMAEIDALKNAADVQVTIRKLHDIGVNVPFAIYGASDNHEPNNVIAHVSASGLGLPDRDYYVKSEPRFVEAREKYLVHVATMFRLAGANEAGAKAAAETVMRFETELASQSLDNVALRDPKATDHKTSIADLQKMTPAFDWNAYFTATKIARVDVNVAEPQFLAEVNRKLEKTPVAEWKAYLKFHLLRVASRALSEPFVREDFEFNQKYLGGAKEMKPRWKRIVETTDDLLGDALGKIYTDKYFPPAAKARMQEMVKNLLWAMGDNIQKLDWMGPETKKRAMEKLSTFNPKVGYPDTWKDYSSLKIDRSSYWNNVVEGARFAVNDNRSTIGKPVDRGRWGMTPPTSNAYYDPSLNEIVFPAGILQSPAFSMGVTDAVNYGAIGVIIGHEISHGFDDQGAQYDAQGRLRNWWTDEDLKRFQERTACVVAQFEEYFIEPGIHHNGKLVLGESIGDIAGAKIALKAYQHSREGKGPEPTIDGFTPEQQFFIAWGQFRGDAIRPETQRLMVQGDPHPIGKYRVIGTVSNMPEFWKAFGCPETSAMVREKAKRCSVW